MKGFFKLEPSPNQGYLASLAIRIQSPPHNYNDNHTCTASTLAHRYVPLLRVRYLYSNSIPHVINGRGELCRIHRKTVVILLNCRNCGETVHSNFANKGRTGGVVRVYSPRINELRRRLQLIIRASRSISVKGKGRGTGVCGFFYPRSGVFRNFVAVVASWGTGKHTLCQCVLELKTFRLLLFLALKKHDSRLTLGGACPSWDLWLCMAMRVIYWALGISH